MSVADLHDLELIWPSPGPKDVVVTGTFDQWSASIHLAKGDTGFFGTVKVPWGQKVAYKYIVDGLWRCRDDVPQEDDGHGNINNVLLIPEKPVAPAIPGPSLIIPLESTHSQGYGDIETMVTAVEYLPPADLTAVRGTLPLPIPQLAVEGLDQVPSDGTPVSEAKLNTAAATEGAISSASEVPEGDPFKQAPSSRDVPILPVNDNLHVSLPATNGDVEAYDAHGFVTHAPLQFTKGESPASPPVPETAEGTVSAPLESAAPQPSHVSQTAQDASALTDSGHVPPAAVPDFPSKQPEAELPLPAEPVQRLQATTSSSIGQASAPSTLAPSTATHKKRRSLLARIKHIFDKGNEKQRGKEKSKH